MEDASTKGNPFALPSLTATWKLPHSTQQRADDHIFYDVKFWPYSSDSESDTIFAVVGCRDILIYGVRVDDDGLAVVHHVLKDQEPLGPEQLPILNTCSWVYIDDSNPLLAVSGSSGQIKILEACSGSLLTTLTGHGAGLINDLATHPIYPWILASASIDSSIRIWDLRRWEDKYESPCIVICGQGQGHKDGILKIAWHLSGRYIVSGAHDNSVCLWTIPDLSDGSEFWDSISPLTRKNKSEAVRVVHYPHFITAAVHSNYVDCLCFFGDMILSKACSESKENKIVLWEITGFDSSLPPPSSDLAPKAQEHKDTRSGFHRNQVGSNGVSLQEGEGPTSQKAGTEDTPLYIQHLEFDLPHTMPFYLRFGLLTPSIDHPNLHPVLVCGNTQSQIFMWDFRRLALGHTDGYQPLPANGQPKHESYIEVEKKPPSKQMKITKQQRRLSTPIGQTPGSQTSSAANTIGESPASQLRAIPNRERYPISDPFKPIKPHKIVTLPDYMPPRKEYNTFFRAVSWSSCGKWCVVVGECEGFKQGRDAQGALLSRWLS